MRLRRAESSDDTTSTISQSTSKPTSGTEKPTRTTNAATTTSLIIDGTESSSALPSAFDSSLGTNFTASSCPKFFDSFLSNKTFIGCHPFSLLLQTSTSFFDASKSFVRITQVLDASCKAEFSTCNSLMDDLANQIVQDSACGADFRLGNPSVTEAYDGFVAYQPMYQVGCLRDSKGNYCFANAVTNASSPEDSYPYYMPVGTGLPGGSRPTCNQCLVNTFKIYDTYAANTTQPLSQNYVDSALQINMACGPDFVNATIAQVSGGSRSAALWDAGGGIAPTITLLTMLLAVFL